MDAKTEEQTKIESLEKRVTELEAHVDELESRIQYLEDLNMISPYIAEYYVAVLRAVRAHYMNQPGFRLCSFTYKNWVDLFAAASIEQEDFEQGARTDTPLNDAIKNAMLKMGGLTHSDWETLQTIRRNRNIFSHPPMNDRKAMEAARRYKEDTGKESALKMMQHLLRR